MANLDYLEHSIPVAPLKICALPGCETLAHTIDKYLVQFRNDLIKRRPDRENLFGYTGDSFLIDCECPRFGSGEAKGLIHESVRGMDLFMLVDVCNYSMTYTVCGQVNHMSPDDHYQNLKRIIAATIGKVHVIKTNNYCIRS